MANNNAIVISGAAASDPEIVQFTINPGIGSSAPAGAKKGVNTGTGEEFYVDGGGNWQAGTGANVNRSRIEITGTIAPNTAISVNASQANTSHGGFSTHNLGANDAALQAAIQASTTRNYVNGIPEPVVRSSTTELEWAFEMRPPTEILVEVDA